MKDVDTINGTLYRKGGGEGEGKGRWHDINNLNISIFNLLTLSINIY